MMQGRESLVRTIVVILLLVIIVTILVIFIFQVWWLWLLVSDLKVLLLLQLSPVINVNQDFFGLLCFCTGLY
jgi:hypothetical protein